MASNIAVRRFHYGLMAPALVVIFAVNIFPFFYALYMSLQYWTLGGQHSPRWAAFGNYTDLLTDDRFRNALVVSLECVVLAVSVEMLLGIGLAFVFNSGIRFLGAFRTLYILPIMAMPLIAGLAWFYMLNENYGTINGILAAVGIPSVPFLTNGKLALLSIVTADVWQWTPFVMIIVFAALQSLQRSVYEAARMDGMTERQIFWRVTLPLLRPALLVVLVFRLIDAFKIVEYVYMMTKGGPAGTTESMPWYIYVTAFQSSDLGYAGALAIIVIIIVTLVSQVLVRELDKGVKV